MRIFLLVLLGLAGCKQMPDVPTIISPYRIDIQQGNVVTQDMVAKLKVGMTRAQVRFALGSPLVVDPFRTDRWDYVFSLQKQGKEIERRRVTVIFDEDKLLRIEGDVVPVDGTRAAESPAEKPPAAVKPPAATAAKPAAAKPVAAKPPEKPPAAAQPPAATAAKPATAKPVVAKPPEKSPVASQPAATVEAAAADKTVAPAADAATAEDAAGAAAPVATQPEAAKSDSAKPGGKTVPAGATKADAAKPDPNKEKPKERGFFGRMMDKIGF